MQTAVNPGTFGLEAFVICRVQVQALLLATGIVISTFDSMSLHPGCRVPRGRI